MGIYGKKSEKEGEKDHNAGEGERIESYDLAMVAPGIELQRALHLCR